MTWELLRPLCACVCGAGNPTEGKVMRYLLVVLALLGGISTAYAGKGGSTDNNGEHNGRTHTNCGKDSGNQGNAC